MKWTSPSLFLLGRPSHCPPSFCHPLLHLCPNHAFMCHALKNKLKDAEYHGIRSSDLHLNHD
eukprot:2929865-Pleurochrysis_carterae.AAC.2